MRRDFVAAVHHAVMAQQHTSVEFLAARLNKAPSTLYNELNPYPHDGSTAKLGLEDAIRICELINDTTPLTQMADHFGYSLYDHNRDPDAENMREEVLQGYQATHEFLRAVDEGRPCSELVPLCNNAQQELEDVAQRKRNEEQSKVRNIG